MMGFDSFRGFTVAANLIKLKKDREAGNFHGCSVGLELKQFMRAPLKLLVFCRGRRFFLKFHFGLRNPSKKKDKKVLLSSVGPPGLGYARSRIFFSK